MREPANLVKVVAAFVGGVVVALGGSLIYVRAHDSPRETVRADPVAQIAQPLKPAATHGQPTPVHADLSAAKLQKAANADLDRPIRSTRTLARVTHREPVITAPVASVVKPDEPPAATAEPRAMASTPSPPSIQPGGPIVTLSPQLAEPASAPVVPAQAPVYSPHVVTLQPGTNLNIRLGENLSTDANYSGDTFRGVLDLPVIADGFVIADKGSKILGRIVTAQKAGKVQGTANLVLTLTEINTTDGQQVRVETNTVENRGVTSRQQDAAEIAGGAALGAIIGALAGGGKGAAIGAGAGGAAGTGAVLLTRGKPAKLATETRLAFQLAIPITITEKLNN